MQRVTLSGSNKVLSNIV